MKRILLATIFAVFFTVPVLSTYAQAQTASNLEGLLGVGYVNRTLPSISARYWINNKVGVEGLLGFEVGDGADLFLIGGKFLSVLKSYKEINVYAAGNISVGSLSDNGSETYTAFRAGAGLGVEWFVLNRLSLSAEAGLEVGTGDNRTRFGTYAGWFPEIGIRFYF